MCIALTRINICKVMYININDPLVFYLQNKGEKETIVFYFLFILQVEIVKLSKGKGFIHCWWVFQFGGLNQRVYVLITQT
jgi:hypothetical protein